jgi:hypothetical protein
MSLVNGNSVSSYQMQEDRLSKLRRLTSDYQHHLVDSVGSQVLSFHHKPNHQLSMNPSNHKLAKSLMRNQLTNLTSSNQSLMSFAGLLEKSKGTFNQVVFPSSGSTFCKSFSFIPKPSTFKGDNGV